MKINDLGENIVKIISDEGFIFKNIENGLLSKEVICHQLTIKNYEEIKIVTYVTK